MIATSGFLTALECTKFVVGRGSAPHPAGGAYSAPPDHLAGGQVACRPLHKNPTPALDPRAYGAWPRRLNPNPQLIFHNSHTDKLHDGDTLHVAVGMVKILELS